MDIDLSGKGALVTGGSLGIGRATADYLARHGASVAIVARDPKRLEDTARELQRNAGGKVVTIPGDASKAEDITRVVGEANRQLGKIDILINNAGSSPAGRIQDISDDTWAYSFNLKFMGYVRCARAVLPAMRARKWGRIVNIIGRGGHHPSAGYVTGAFNAALRHFTQALAEEGAADNVLVNGINPGATDTPRIRTLHSQMAKFRGISEAEIAAEEVKRIPLGRIGTAEDIAAMALFLCSEHAGFISGTLINIDGASTKMP
jgi:3-oxoacyl-[acyl-carrier protein] reductase